jgi:threonine dehydratase
LKVAEFPERPGALRNFLAGMQHDWNITMFHYRNHGAGKDLIVNLVIGFSLLAPDVGKILAGIQVPEADYAAFDEFLTKLNYPYVEETNNPIYKQYLQGGE